MSSLLLRHAGRTCKWKLPQSRIFTNRERFTQTAFIHRMASPLKSVPVEGGNNRSSDALNKLTAKPDKQNGNKNGGKQQQQQQRSFINRKRKEPSPVPEGVAQFNLSKRERAKLRRKGLLTVVEGTHDDVLALDLKDLMARLTLGDIARDGEQPVPEGQNAEGTEAAALPEPGTEIEVKVLELSSTGDGLAVQEGSNQIYLLSFVVPGDVAKVKVYRHEKTHTMADLISIVTPSPARDDKRILCPHFSSCAGCQFQPMSYEDQLAHKRKVVEKAFKNFSDLPPELIPAAGETMGSPLQYGYRTKLTPHFAMPPGARRKRGPPIRHQEVPPIGFNMKGRKSVLDIEDCPIGTEIINKGMRRERAVVASKFDTYANGATILLRESTERFYKKDAAETPIPTSIGDDQIRVETDDYVEIKSCISEGSQLATEYVDNFVFKNKASSFFQNNNSILPSLTSYVRENAISYKDGKPSITNFIDAYCGSGLFSITCAPLFMSDEVKGRIIGIDIDGQATRRAGLNAKLNNYPDGRCEFIEADAPQLFKKLDGFNPDETAVVIDPPRKGCDVSFLTQLLVFKPKRLVYVSCNVHTQARDVGILVRGYVDGLPAPVGGARYKIESVRGFDLFPQTSHVEGVAVLTRVDEDVDAQMSTLERSLDQPAGEKVHGLGRILPVADVATLDGDQAHHHIQDVRLDLRARGQTYAHHGAPGADVLCRLLEGARRHGQQHGGVGAEAVGGGLAHVGHDVCRRGKVDKGGGAQLPQARLALLLARVDGDDLQAHGPGVLHRHGAQAAARAHDGYKLARARARLLEALVDGDARAQHRRDGLEAHLLGQAGHEGGLGDGVLLEGAVDRVARERDLGTEHLVGGPAKVAVLAAAVDPLDADVVADLDVLDQLTARHHYARALVPAHEREPGRDRPVAVHGVQVRVAHARVLYVDEDLIGTRLGHGDFLVNRGWKKRLWGGVGL
ncbi:hypothetical protein PspLS_06486 [Pyricularia sp. CBS 133598]|nr:hypothetical protein PspLS_06486 [Pyricularia sp. CBS 133598]